MSYTIKNITTSFNAAQPHGSSRVNVFDLNNVLSLDIILGIAIIISILGIIILG